MTKIISRAKEIIEEFFQKAGFEIEIEKIEEKDKTIFTDLKLKKSERILGEISKLITASQRLLNTILKKKFSEEIFLDLDISSYKKRKVEYLKELAKELADEVAISKKEKVLPPMTASERRIIHLVLAERDDVVSESFGKEPNRKVIIKPKLKKTNPN